MSSLALTTTIATTFTSSARVRTYVRYRAVFCRAPHMGATSAPPAMASAGHQDPPGREKGPTGPRRSGELARLFSSRFGVLPAAQQGYENAYHPNLRRELRSSRAGPAPPAHAQRAVGARADTSRGSRPGFTRRLRSTDDPGLERPTAASAPRSSRSPRSPATSGRVRSSTGVNTSSLPSGKGRELVPSKRARALGPSPQSSRASRRDARVLAKILHEGPQAPAEASDGPAGEAIRHDPEPRRRSTRLAAQVRAPPRPQPPSKPGPSSSPALQDKKGSYAGEDGRTSSLSSRAQCAHLSSSSPERPSRAALSNDTSANADKDEAQVEHLLSGPAMGVQGLALAKFLLPVGTAEDPMSPNDTSVQLTSSAQASSTSGLLAPPVSGPRPRGSIAGARPCAPSTEPHAGPDIVDLTLAADDDVGATERQADCSPCPAEPQPSGTATTSGPSVGAEAAGALKPPVLVLKRASERPQVRAPSLSSSASLRAQTVVLFASQTPAGAAPSVFSDEE